LTSSVVMACRPCGEVVVILLVAALYTVVVVLPLATTLSVWLVRVIGSRGLASVTERVAEVAEGPAPFTAEQGRGLSFGQRFPTRWPAASLADSTIILSSLFRKLSTFSDPVTLPPFSRSLAISAAT